MDYFGFNSQVKYIVTFITDYFVLKFNKDICFEIISNANNMSYMPRVTKLPGNKWARNEEPTVSEPFVD